jgi:hypothetical protein
MWTKLLISMKKSVYLNYIRKDQDIPFVRAIPGAHPMAQKTRQPSGQSAV